jgi:hypothetical protein
VVIVDKLRSGGSYILWGYEHPCPEFNENINFNSLKTELILHNIYKDPDRTSQETHYVSFTKTNQLMLFRDRVAVYCETHKEHINALCG